MSKNKLNKIVLYQAKNGAIEFRGDFESENTVWGTQKQIAELFDIDRTVVTRHIRNIFKDGELNKEVVCAKFAHTTSHGAIKGKTQTKEVKFYNLDIILAVGYRTNSKKAIEFRKWATKILKQHLVKGYTINKKVIAKNYNNFMLAVKSVQELAEKKYLISTKDVLGLVKAFVNIKLCISQTFK